MLFTTFMTSIATNWNKNVMRIRSFYSFVHETLGKLFECLTENKGRPKKCA